MDEQRGLDYFKELTDKIDAYKNNSLVTFFEDIAKAITSLESYGEDVNKVFGETRQRIGDIKTALADSLPGISRLGGDIKDVQTTIQDIALASRRNVIATTEQTEKLFAASEVTGVSVRNLVDGFADVGVGIGQMTKQLETSINYVKSIGGNTREVFKLVAGSLDQLNRYQFEGGIKGLTKMAAQASMFRFDMGETLRLADDLYKPERAIEVASSFQRLGMAVGDLADPFRLMNASINDPQGLQDSLANAAKQFAYFDDKTKTFKISPEGVIRLKELGAQTQINANEMMKMGLAAKEADARISAISAVGLSVKEEDKLLLSNLTRMGDGGEFEISVKDSETGKRSFEKLTNLGQQQLDAILKEQRETQDMSMEDIARSQLGYSEMVAGDVKSIYNGFLYGFGSSSGVNREVEGIRKMTNDISGTFSKMFGTTKSGRAMSSAAEEEIKQFIKDAKDPNKGLKEALASFAERVSVRSEKLGSEFKESMDSFMNKSSDKLTTNTLAEQGMKTLVDQLLGDKRKPNISETNNTTPNGLMGRSMPIDMGSRNMSRNSLGDGVTTTMTPSKVDIGGKIVVEFTASQGTVLTQKVLDDWANSPQTKKYFASLAQPNNPLKAPVSTNFGN